MNTLRAAVAVSFVIAMIGPAAAVQYGPRPPDGPAAQCLTNEQKALIKKKLEVQGRFQIGEKEESIDPDYFLGKWTMEWVAPDSPFGSAGEVTGSLAVTHVEGCYYEGRLEAKNEDGTYTSRLELIYNVDTRFLIWIDHDSRGFTTLRQGVVGGDLGGYYTHFWEQPVTRVKGMAVRARGTTFVQSPEEFHIRQQVSIDGGPYTNLGTIRFVKQDVTH